MSKEELSAKLADIDVEIKRSYATKDKNTAKKKELKKMKSRILNLLNRFGDQLAKTTGAKLKQRI